MSMIMSFVTISLKKTSITKLLKLQDDIMSSHAVTKMLLAENHQILE